jgi:hypothetical protein
MAERVIITEAYASSVLASLRKERGEENGEAPILKSFTTNRSFQIQPMLILRLFSENPA